MPALNSLSRRFTCLCLVLSLSVLSACERAVIKGKVVNATGQPIPGVAVSAGQDGPQALTDVGGDYAIPVDAALHQLKFMKSGYTSAETSAQSARDLDCVTLWPLPLQSGVYFVNKQFKYHPLARTVPKPFSTDDGIVYGITRLPDLPQTDVSQMPQVVFYGLPFYDTSICKLHKMEASPLDTPQVKQTIWARETSMPIELTAIDEPDRALWSAKLLQPLEEGIYAITWGGLEKHKPTDDRLFLFRVGQEAPDDASRTDQPKPHEQQEQTTKTKTKIYDTDVNEAPAD